MVRRTLFRTVKLQKRHVLPVVVVLGVIGSIVLLRSFAAVSGVIAFEAEAGSWSGQAVIETDGAASGGQAVTFRPSTTNPPTPPPLPPPGSGTDTALAIRIDNSGRGNVELENRLMKVNYGAYPVEYAPGFVSFAITIWTNKATGQDITKQTTGTGRDIYNPQFCYNGGANSVPKTKMTVVLIQDTATEKSVRINEDGCNTQHVMTIFAHSPVIRLEYESYTDHFMDDRNSRGVPSINYPGQMMPEPHDFTVYQNGAWHRDFMCPADGGSWCDKHVFLSSEGGNDPLDGGALGYKGNLIYGYTRKADQTGTGRVMRASEVDYLSNQVNLSSDMSFRQGLPKMTGYIFLVTGGPSELIATGKAIADGTIPTK